MDIIVSNREADIKELNVDFQISIPYFYALYEHFKGTQDEYVQYVKSLNLDYVFQQNDVAELLENANVIRETIIENFKNGNISSFDKELLNCINAKSLPKINENDFYKLTFNMSNFANEDDKKAIKDIFLDLNSNSFLYLKNIDNDDLELFYCKRGIYKEDDKYVITNARERATIIENFSSAKDNNFISAKFISDFAFKLSNAGFKNDNFSCEYFNGHSKELKKKSLDEIMYYANLSIKEKKEALEKEKISKQASEIASKEIKSENNSRRNSLKAGSNDKQIDNAFANITIRSNEKSAKNITKLDVSNAESIEEISMNNKTITQQSINDIIEKSFELYRQKEREKTELRLKKAQKDSENAYFDLKRNMQESGSLIDSLDYIRQKYGNEDTIRFASFQFTQDILNSKQKDDEILELKSVVKDLNENIRSHNDVLEKKDNYISELKSAVAKKSAEVTRLNEDLSNKQEEFQSILEQQADDFTNSTNSKIDEITEKFEKLLNERDEAIAESNELIKDFELELEKIKEKNENLTEKVNSIPSLESEISFFKNELEKQNQMNQRLLEENSRLKASNENVEFLKSQLEKSNSQIQILMEVLSNKPNHSQNYQENTTNKQNITIEENNNNTNDNDDLGIDKIIKNR
ncbi:MAG: hypothetical protein IKK93_04985 [Campylobacter sp.]|nr:hypothetical protein [Campylobacter sp.]